MRLTKLEERELAKYIEYFSFKDYLKDKTFLITGSKGIIGSGLIKWILYENMVHGTNAHVIASTRNPEVIPEYFDDDNIEFCMFGSELQACKEKGVDYVLHAAAPTNNRVLMAQPVESLRVIIDGTEELINTAKEHNAVMLYFSSAEAYGTPSIDKPLTEDYVGAVNSLNTRSCYTLGKKVAELMCKSYFEEYGVDVRIIRPTVILGLWQPYDSVKVEAELMRCVVENLDFTMKSDGSTKKSVIYSLDAVSAALTVLFKGTAGEAYNATNPETYCSVRERAEQIRNMYNKNIKILFAQVDKSISEGYLPKYMLLEDVTKISNIGWKPYADIEYIFNIDIERFKEMKKCKKT